jgi:hypothetical protein
MAHNNTRQVLLPADHKTLDQTFAVVTAIKPNMTQADIMYNAGMKHVLDVLKKDWTRWT